MKLQRLLIVLGVVFGLTAGASQAQAGKGVKKTGEHHHHGIVVAVDQDKNLIEVKTSHKSKNKTTGEVTTTSQIIKLDVTANSKFFIAQNDMKSPATFARVQKGEHVSFSSHNHQVDSLVIHHKNKKKNQPNPLG